MDIIRYSNNYSEFQNIGIYANITTYLNTQNKQNIKVN
jgi:hypothetical protein